MWIVECIFPFGILCLQCVYLLAVKCHILSVCSELCPVGSSTVSESVSVLL